MCRIVEEIVEKERAEGRAEARAELGREVALKMVALKYSYEEISEITEIPVDEIKKLAVNLPA